MVSQFLADRPFRSCGRPCRTVFNLMCIVFFGVLIDLPVSRAESVTLGAARDNTLFHFDPLEPSSSLNSNGQGNFFSAGRSLERDAIRRGLVYFDLPELPAGSQVVAGTARLDLHVVDVPRRDANPRPFWIVPVADQPWGEGASAAMAGVSGAGSGAAAQANDATWFHAAYDPQAHEDGVFIPGAPGFWNAPGILGADPLDARAAWGDPLAIIPSEIGPASLAGSQLEADLQRWLAGEPNYGWLIVGDETLDGEDVSSVRGFASREHPEVAMRPQLFFEYRIIPEPQTSPLLVMGLVLSYVASRRTIGA